VAAAGVGRACAPVRRGIAALSRAARTSGTASGCNAKQNKTKKRWLHEE
jgi:hypothetical protein